MLIGIAELSARKGKQIVSIVWVVSSASSELKIDAFSITKTVCQANNGPFVASGHMVHTGGQAAHWDIQNKELKFKFILMKSLAFQAQITKR